MAPEDRTPAVVPSEVPTLEPEILYWFPSLVAEVAAAAPRPSPRRGVRAADRQGS